MDYDFDNGNADYHDEQCKEWVSENTKEIMTDFLAAIKRGDKQEIDIVKSWLDNATLTEWEEETEERRRTKDDFIQGIIDKDGYCLETVNACFDLDLMYDWCDIIGVLQDLDFDEEIFVIGY